MMTRLFLFGWIVGLVLGLPLCPAVAEDVIPHAQDRPPGPALSPQEALANMQVPQGFAVELFAAEPDLVNPVSMAFDARGRVWVTESLEYPRSAPGVGKDRIKILEDTDGDGKADKFTIFAEGLNIPSGIALGYGGAFVANAPDLLFLRDTNGDDKADESQVLVTGFGRSDTHELPNSLIWGPDGWLYGLNGVFNHSKITHQGTTHEFNCAVWRYHPRSKKFDLYCEGTSNPWGLDYDGQGNFFVSACVIDHLWHLTRSGYYHRQAGPYPPFTWKIESIVDHKHQKAAYCGLCFYDADVYPDDYRGTLLMGNIHGNCLNGDQLQPSGASYFATPRPDFLSANDAWFMPVVQKVGPDGCVWVLDWYDRYHCYQDARRDPEGIDRLKGRLYRVPYKKAAMPGRFDLAQLSAAELLPYLGHANNYYRRWARQLLSERGEQHEQLQAIVLDDGKSLMNRTEALWTLLSMGELHDEFHGRLLTSAEPVLRNWGVRATANVESPSAELLEKLQSMADDADPRVRLELAIIARQLFPETAHELLTRILSQADNDDSELTLRIVWQNLLPLFDRYSEALVAQLTAPESLNHASTRGLLPRTLQRLLAMESAAPAMSRILDFATSSLTEEDNEDEKAETAATCLRMLLEAWLNGEVREEYAELLRKNYYQPIGQLAKDLGSEQGLPALAFAVALGDKDSQPPALKAAADRKQEPADRELLVRALIHAQAEDVLPTVARMLRNDSKENNNFRVDVLSALTRSKEERVAATLLDQFASFPDVLRPQVLDLLCSRPGWAKLLMDSVDAKTVPANLVNGNQLRRLSTLPDESLRGRVEQIWGKVRTERDPKREQVLARFSRALQGKPGDPTNGSKVFAKVCAQCHKLNGQGHEVGPDLTSNGRSSLDQLLSNLLDPNLVIGKDYQAYTVATADGRVLTGLLAENSQERVVLKVAGGKSEVIPRADIEAMKRSELSLMPEDLEKQINEQEFRDLIGYLLQEKPAP